MLLCWVMRFWKVKLVGNTAGCQGEGEQPFKWIIQSVEQWWLVAPFIVACHCSEWRANLMCTTHCHGCPCTPPGHIDHGQWPREARPSSAKTSQILRALEISGDLNLKISKCNSFLLMLVMIGCGRVQVHPHIAWVTHLLCAVSWICLLPVKVCVQVWLFGCH